MINKLLKKTTAILLGTLLSLTTLTGCGNNNTGYISSLCISPSAKYQAEVVQISYGATGGENVIFVERADKTTFPLLKENNTPSSIEIKELRSAWSAKRDIQWITDDTFIVITGDRLINYDMVTINDDHYTVTEGLEIDNDQTIILDSSISGDTIEITASIHVKNNTDCTFSFIAQSHIDVREKSIVPTTLIKVNAETDLDTGDSLKLMPGEEKDFKIKLTGAKDSDKSFVQKEPDIIYVSITKIE